MSDKQLLDSVGKVKMVPTFTTSLLKDTVALEEWITSASAFVSANADYDWRGIRQRVEVEEVSVVISMASTFEEFISSLRTMIQPTQLAWTTHTGDFIQILVLLINQWCT